MFNQLGDVQRGPEIDLAPAPPKPTCLFTITNHQNWVVNCIKSIEGSLQYELINPQGIKCIASRVEYKNVSSDIEQILQQPENQRNVRIFVDYLRKTTPEEITISDINEDEKLISFILDQSINKIGTLFSTVQISCGALMVGTGTFAPVGFMIIGAGGNCFIYSYSTKDKDFTVKKYLSEALSGFAINGVLGGVSACVSGASFAMRAAAQLVASVGSSTIASAVSEYWNTGVAPTIEKLKEVALLGTVNGLVGTAVDLGVNALVGPAASKSCKDLYEVGKKTLIGGGKAGVTKVATNVSEMVMGKDSHWHDGIGGAVFMGSFVSASIGTAETVKYHQDYLYQLKIEQEQAQIETQKSLIEAEKIEQLLFEEDGRLKEAQSIAKQKLESITNENQLALGEKQQLLTQLESLNGSIEQNQNAMKEQRLNIIELQKDYVKLKTELTNIQTQYNEIAAELSRLQQVREKHAAYITKRIEFYQKNNFHTKINGQRISDPEKIKNAFLNGEKVRFKKNGESESFKLDRKVVEQLTRAEQTQNTQKQHLEGQLQQKRVQVTSTEASLREQHSNIKKTTQQQGVFREKQHQHQFKIIELETKILPLPEVDFSPDLENLKHTKKRYECAADKLSSVKAFEMNLKAPLNPPEKNCDPLSTNPLPVRPSRKLLMSIFGPEPTFEITDCDSDELFKHIVLVQGINDKLYTYGFENDDIKAKFCLKEPDFSDLHESPDFHDLRSLFALLGVISPKGEIGHHLNFEQRELEVGLINQPTVHWSWNKLVEANSGGDWENSLIAVLEPYQAFESKEIGKPFNLAPYDTFTFGTHKLSKNSIILIREGLIPDQLQDTFQSHYKQFTGKIVFYSKHKKLREAVFETLNNHYSDVWHMCDPDGKLIGKENKYTAGGYRKMTCVKTKDGKIIQLLRDQNTKLGKALNVKGRMVELHQTATNTLLRFDNFNDLYFSKLGQFRSARTDSAKKIKLGIFDSFDVRKGKTEASNPMFAGKVKQSRNLLGMGSLYCIEIYKGLREYDPATGCHVYADYLIKQSILADMVSLFYEKYPERSADELSLFEYKLILESQLLACTSLLEQILNKLNIDLESDMEEALDLFDQYATLLEEAIQRCENAKEKVKKTLSAKSNVQPAKNPAILMIAEDDWMSVAKPNEIDFDIGKNWPLTNELNIYKDKIFFALPYKTEQLVALYHALTPSDENNKENYQRNVIRGLICAVIQEQYFQKQHETSSPTVFLKKLQKNTPLELQDLICETDKSSIWINLVFNTISNSNLNSSDILEALSKNDSLRECYSKFAGVTEGYTVGQHTQMVLDVARKYRGSLVKNVEPLVDWDEFILFLALHDIGKGMAKEECVAGNTHGLSFKQLELKHSREILESTMKDLNVLPAKIKVFKAMLMDDFLGDYLQFDIDLEKASIKVLEMAKTADCNPLQFYHLFRVFHLVDAASYPSLKIFFTFKEDMLGYSEAYESMIGQLTMNIKS